ncbi:amidase family protein [Terrabacter sp. LjRoot27]|uniref:amidase family protein n=1 Tax=Terrabacter sp. LjRoot27 TaxID=3342306 RepID=UPI003ECD9A4B
MNRYLLVARSTLTGLRVRRGAASSPRLRPLDLSPFEDALRGFDGDRAERVGALVHDASIVQLGRLMDSGRLSSTDLTLLCLSRIRAQDETLRSLVELNPHALVEAASADEQRRSGAVTSSLCGIPLTLKDNVETAPPLHTTAGSALLADHQADHDAPLVVRLRDAGAVILGKANLSELAGALSSKAGFSAVGGQSVNPFGAQFSPAGSSSGSAIGVAAGLCVASIGTETSGSLVAPAAFSGVVAMKPSRGVVATDGIVPLVHTQDSAGPVARSVADAAAVLEVIAKHPVPTDLSDDALEGVRVGVLRVDVLSQTSPFEDTSENATVLARVVEGLTRAGASAADVLLGLRADSLDEYEKGFVEVVLGGLRHETLPYLAAATAAATAATSAADGDRPRVTTAADLAAWNLADPRRRMPSGQAFLDLAVLRGGDADAHAEAARGYRDRAAALLAETFDGTRTEMLVSLSNRHSAVYATAGFPAVTVPAGMRSNGMPVGATFIGRIGEDGRLLAMAYAFERVTRLRRAPIGAGRR